MKRAGVAFAVILACLGLCACGNQGGPSVTAALRGAAGGVIGKGAERKSSNSVIAPDDLRSLAANSPVQFITVPSLGVGVGAIPVAVNGPKVTWGSGNLLVTTQSGFLLSTRGLPGDLMAVEVDGFGEALSGGGAYSRDMEWVDGRDTAITKQFSCVVTATIGRTVAVMEQSYQGTMFEDRCSGEGIEFVNIYFLDAGGVLRTSRQWVSETVGYLHSQQL